MTLFGEFHFEVSALPLGDTLVEVQDTVVEVERVVVSKNVLTPYVWVDSDDFPNFERTAGRDSAVDSLERMHRDEGAALYRIDWSTPVEETIYEAVNDGIIPLEASGNGRGWEVRMRFADRDELQTFQTFCRENEIHFHLKRLFDESRPMAAGKFGLTEKQHQALVTAWEADYFDSQQNVTLDEVASSLDITRQSLSQRLQRAHHTLIANTLILTPPTDPPGNLS